ncbi:Cell division protein FtsI (Peptidoglycan synthetase) [Methylophaga frappieri]|uniref:Peptidoglycan D,D-transpeptidase FtsI n=1 Tax=Methylophaga frappieri (strain ATCC BAA-2434 / DSM 25690 / JAM7) TaxID=754477 RepID=I1YGK1_METFJ|nr:penicillin-binding transpeptidase domain-containing protein [Methylophaga frappieri]AFJ02044.1 Cell division protein FtsI (Peptidoglycan synthetase) [Methylophaga frappieri]
MSRHSAKATHGWRLNIVRAGFVLVVAGLLWRLVDIQILNNEFLRNQGDARHLRNVPVVAHRGMILDRHGEPLAISTPVHSVWLNPQVTRADSPNLDKVANLLNVSLSGLQEKIANYGKREFVYIKRRITPALAAQVKQLKVPGVALQREYKRYYPTAEVSAHMLGFTNIDDVGQEGLELIYEPTLTGVPGLKRMIRDSRGNYVGGGEQIRAAKAGENLQISMDLRLQYLTYNALKSAVKAHQAVGGTAVIVDVKTGEVLAMANQPAFNPNNRTGLRSSDFRNRAVTDLFEPGSTVKPFTVLSGLKSGLFDEQTIINTHPGVFRVSGHSIRDFRDYGEIDLARLIQVSSNIASSKIALELDPNDLWQDFAAFGLGSPTGGYFPGEAEGHLPDPRDWRKLDRATLAYGYGLATNALQLARAYAVIGNGGVLRDITFLKQDKPMPGRRVFASDLIGKVRKMMELTVQPGGTATRAAVVNYRVAGKTGTVKKTSATGGYTESEYQSVFAGLIPASEPRLAMVVMVDSPGGDEYYGGAVAAPVFAEVMTGAMRLLNIAPDALPADHLQMAGQS